MKPPRSGDAGDIANEPKWPYYKQFSFLKDIVKPRAFSNNLKPKRTTENEDGDEVVGDEQQETNIVTNETETENTPDLSESTNWPNQVSLQREGVY